MYDLSPIMVEYSLSSKSFLHFLTNLCAIIGTFLIPSLKEYITWIERANCVGGVFTVAGLIDSFVYSGLRTIKKKMELGKFN